MSGLAGMDLQEQGAPPALPAGAQERLAAGPALNGPGKIPCKGEALRLSAPCPRLFTYPRLPGRKIWGIYVLLARFLHPGGWARTPLTLFVSP